MPCFTPIPGWKSRALTERGKQSVVFNPKFGWLDQPIEVPCGQCIGCRLERSRQWAIRCMHEASLHDHNCFLTLTYADQHLPPGSSLRPRDMVLFLKRLRKRYGEGIRFFQCGEYGERFQRPHHHVLLFGHRFEDQELHSASRGVKLYTSEALSQLWPYGYCLIGDVTFESAAYVARYVTKKITGPTAAEHYGDRVPEYITMSRRPGIARAWIEQFHEDVYPKDYFTMRGLKLKPPKYYDNIFEKHLDNRGIYANIVDTRVVARRNHSDDNTPERLATRLELQKLRASKLKRSFETGESP